MGLLLGLCGRAPCLLVGAGPHSHSLPIKVNYSPKNQQKTKNNCLLLEEEGVDREISPKKTRKL